MRLKIIYPTHKGNPKAMGATVPYVLPYLAAITPKGIDVELVNMLRERIDYNDAPDIAAISVKTPMADESYMIADKFREKGAKVVLGGHHTSAMPIEAAGHADAVFIGEAEETWPRFLKDLKEGRAKRFYVAGPYYDTKGLPKEDVYIAMARPDLSKGAPFARRDLLKSRYLFDSIVSTRGCPYACKFCGTTGFYGNKVRHRPVDDVVDELKTMGRFWFLGDDDIFNDLDYRHELYSKIAEKKGFNRWHGAGTLSIGYDKDGDKVLKKAAESGLFAVFVGIESVNELTLKETGVTSKLRQQTENIDFERIKSAIKKIQSYGILVIGFFVLGFDTDTVDTFDKTLAFCDETGVIPIPFLLVPLPGTVLWDEYKDRLYHSSSWENWDACHSLYKHPSIGQKEMEGLLYKLRKSAYTYNRIMKRLGPGSLGTMIAGLSMQMGLKNTFEADWRRVRGSE